MNIYATPESTIFGVEYTAEDGTSYLHKGNTNV